MKKNLYLLLFTFLSLTGLRTNAQSIYFTSPTNGQTITSIEYGSTASSVPVNFRFYYSVTPYPPAYNLASRIRLITHNATYDSQEGDIPQWFYLESNTYTWRVELLEAFVGASNWEKTAEQTITFYVKYPVISLNSFGGGIINVDGQQRSNGFTVNKLKNEILLVGAIDQNINSTDYIWNQSGTNNSIWERKPMGQNLFSAIPGASSRDYGYIVTSNDNGAQIRAAMRKIVNVNFQNSFVGIGNGGVINVNNTQYNSPTSSFSVVELNPINALPASGQIINGIVYNFSKWSDGNTTAKRTFNPSANATYTAQYIGKPSTYDLNTGWSLNLHHSTTIGQPIVLYWNEHPNTYVTKYQIWKKEKYNGVTSDPILMATVNRGTTSYVDDNFVYSLLKNKYWIYYAVVPYYSLENTYSDPGWMPVTAEINYKAMDSTYAVTSTVLENSLSNFPNPFNPATTINFSIKEAGHVNIKVFDLIGQQVAELVNEEKQAGSYSVRFDASKLPSGIYIYTINSGVFTQTRKMLLMK